MSSEGVWLVDPAEFNPPGWRQFVPPKRLPRLFYPLEHPMAYPMNDQQVETIEGLTHFIVEYSQQRDGKAWWQNHTAQVIAIDIYRVLEIFREQHPDARVHVARRLAPSAQVYLDRTGGKVT